MGLNIVQYSAQDKSSGCCGSELSDVGFFGGGVPLLMLLLLPELLVISPSSRFNVQSAAAEAT